MSDIDIVSCNILPSFSFVVFLDNPYIDPSSINIPKIIINIDFGINPRLYF